MERVHEEGGRVRERRRSAAGPCAVSGGCSPIALARREIIAAKLPDVIRFNLTDSEFWVPKGMGETVHDWLRATRIDSKVAENLVADSGGDGTDTVKIETGKIDDVEQLICAELERERHA